MYSFLKSPTKQLPPILHQHPACIWASQRGAAVGAANDPGCQAKTAEAPEMFLRFPRPVALHGIPVLDVQFHLLYHRKLDEDLLIDEEAQKYIANGDNVDLQDCKVTKFYADAKAFFIAACKYLKKKLPFQYFLKRFPCPLPLGASGEDFLLELATFQATDITACKKEYPGETWKAAGELNDENGTVLLKFLPSFMLCVGQFSETGLHKWMPFVIFRKTWHSDADISDLGFVCFYAFIFEWKKSKPVG